MASAVAAMFASLKKIRGVSIVYRRGSTDRALKAVVGRTDREQTDERGLVTQTQTRDYLIAAADLVDGGDALEPQDGDTIIETSQGRTRTYEVLPIGAEPCWRWSDPSLLIRRVHAKQIAEAAA